MRPSFRSALLLGSAFVAISVSPALADDPLLPEGADRPAVGKELVLPPVINDAPPNTEIVLPPPGQEHLLGARPANAKPVEKVEARIADEPTTEAVTADQGDKPAKRGKRKAPKETQTARAAVAPAASADVYAGIQKTSVPDQSQIVPEDGAKTAPGIVETNSRMADLTVPAMGGPELAGPPSPQDGMAKQSKPIRNGDTVEPRVADALTTPPKSEAAPNIPAMERFEIAQASSSPMPVTPAKAMNQGSPDWDVELSGAIGYGRVETGAQRYFGEVSRNSGSVSGLGNWGSAPITDNLVETDDEDDTITYEAAAKFNLTGHVEPLGGGSNVTPYVKIGVSGYEAEFSSSHGPLESSEDTKIVAAGTGNDEESDDQYEMNGFNGWHGGYNRVRNHKFNLVDNIIYRGDETMIRGLLEYGQTWHGSSGIDVTGFAQFAYTWRDYSHTLTFDAQKRRRYWSEPEVDAVVAETPSFTHHGVYQTDLDSNTASFGLGTAISVPLSADKRWRADANVRGSYDITSVDGTDSLGVSRNALVKALGNDNNSGFDKFQRITLRKTEESFGYGGGVGISYQLSKDVGIRLGADYSSQEAAPVVIRDGVNPSRVELEREDVLVGTLTATIKF